MASHGGLIRTESVEVTDSMIQTIVETGGYTHPLFRPNSIRAEGEGTTPLPGQGVLLLMGGLLEQSGMLDHAIALLELKSVRFFKMVRSGSELSVEVKTGERRSTSSGKAVQEYVWTVRNQDDERVAEAEAVMLLKSAQVDEAP